MGEMVRGVGSRIAMLSGQARDKGLIRITNENEFRTGGTGVRMGEYANMPMGEWAKWYGGPVRREG